MRLYELDKMTLPEIARRFSLPQGTLKGWVYASTRGKLGEVVRNQKPLPELEMELARVKRETAGCAPCRLLHDMSRLAHETMPPTLINNNFTLHPASGGCGGYRLKIKNVPMQR